MNKKNKVSPMKLTPENVQHVLTTCLYVRPMSKAILEHEPLIVEGYVHRFEFDRHMLNKERKHIEEMLAELPEEFKRGNSFMEMYHKRNGEQWTGVMKPMEDLMALGIAVGKISYMQPRDIWWSLPGGMPNLIIK